MDLQLKGKKAIVTGGSAGIGLSVARLLAEEGVEVTIPGRHGKKLNEAIASLPGSVHGIEGDLGTAEGARKLIEEVPEIDILVNNLGIYESKDFVDISDAKKPFLINNKRVMQSGGLGGPIVYNTKLKKWIMMCTAAHARAGQVRDDFHVMDVLLLIEIRQRAERERELGRRVRGVQALHLSPRADRTRERGIAP